MVHCTVELLGHKSITTMNSTLVNIAFSYSSDLRNNVMVFRVDVEIKWIILIEYIYEFRFIRDICYEAKWNIIRFKFESSSDEYLKSIAHNANIAYSNRISQTQFIIWWYHNT